MKKKLRKHIEKCFELLEKLETSSLSQKDTDSLSKIIHFIDNGMNSLPNISDEQKFITLINSVPAVAIQGYDKNREVIYWNAASEKVYGYTREEALGKKLENLIVPENLRNWVLQGIEDWREKGTPFPPGELYLQRKNGALVQVFSSHVKLGTTDPEIFCIDIDLSEIKKLRNENQNLEAKNRTDALTGCLNRGYFDTIIDSKIQRAKASLSDLSLIMMDIDHFKKINDQYGHDIGDLSLIQLVNLVKKNTREEDMLFRWGGEEFMLLIESSAEDAVLTANKLRELIYFETQKNKRSPAFTASFGVITLLGYKDFSCAYRAIDKKLYKAKQQGRNRVIF